MSTIKTIAPGNKRHYPVYVAESVRLEDQIRDGEKIQILNGPNTGLSGKLQRLESNAIYLKNGKAISKGDIQIIKRGMDNDSTLLLISLLVVAFGIYLITLSGHNWLL